MGDQDRHRLLQRLRQVLGDEEAATLMENLPPLPWSELATKADLEQLATKADLEQLATKAELDTLAIKAELETFAKDTKAELNTLATRAELERFATDTKAELDTLATKAELERFVTTTDERLTEVELSLRTLERSLDLRFDRSEARMETLIHRTVSAQTRMLLLALVGAVLATAGVSLGAAGL